MIIESTIGPSFAAELRAVDLNNGVSWTPDGVYIADGVSSGDVARLRTIIKAHDPTRPAPVPAPVSCTKLGLRRAFVEMGVWPKVRDFIKADSDRQEEWDLATELKLTDHVMTDAIAAFAAEGIDIDPVQLAIRANELVA